MYYALKSKLGRLCDLLTSLLKQFFNLILKSTDKMQISRQFNMLTQHRYNSNRILSNYSHISPKKLFVIYGLIAYFFD